MKPVTKQWRIQGRGPGGPDPPLFLDQNEARRPEKWLPPSPPPSLCEGLDPPLQKNFIGLSGVNYRRIC